MAIQNWKDLQTQVLENKTSLLFFSKIAGKNRTFKAFVSEKTDGYMKPETKIQYVIEWNIIVQVQHLQKQMTTWILRWTTEFWQTSSIFKFSAQHIKDYLIETKSNYVINLSPLALP